MHANQPACTATLRKVCVGLRIITLLQSVECIFLGIIVFKCLFSWAINNFRAKIVLVICRKWFVDAKRGVPLSSSQIALHRWSELSWKPENLSGPVNASSYLNICRFCQERTACQIGNRLKTGWTRLGWDWNCDRLMRVVRRRQYYYFPLLFQHWVLSTPSKQVLQDI